MASSQHESVQVRDWSRKFDKFAAQKAYSDSDETEEDGDDIFVTILSPVEI